MGLAAIAMLGALLSPQDLAVQTAGALAPPAGLTLDASALASMTAGEATMSMSSQTLTNSVNGVSFTGTVQAGLRSGDINTSEADASGFSGVQTVNISTGFGSSVQGATSIAAGSVVFDANN